MCVSVSKPVRVCVSEVSVCECALRCDITIPMCGKPHCRKMTEEAEGREGRQRIRAALMDDDGDDDGRMAHSANGGGDVMDGVCCNVDAVCGDGGDFLPRRFW